MKKVFIFGCGQLFCKKQDILLKKYEVVGVFDNFKTGKLKLKDGKVVPIVKPTRENINIYSVIIMRIDFFDAWVQLYELGIEKKLVIFPYNIEPLEEMEALLFSNGEKLIIENNLLHYYDQWNNNYIIQEQRKFDDLVKIRERNKINSRNIVQGCPINPLNRTFGFSRGTPIDRYYIEAFLQLKRDNIRGDVLEVAENIYTKKYGENVLNSYMLHVSSNENKYIKGNFETGEGIKSETMDCIILTQVLPFIFNCRAAISNIYRMLKPKGVCLISVGGITQISRYDMEQWGHYWSFTDLSLRKLLEENIPKDKIEIRTYGNVKSAIAMLYGIAAEEITKEELDYVDKDYQVTICATIWK